LLFLYPPNDFDPESYDRERAFLDEHADAQGPIVQQVEGDFLHSLYVARAFGALAAGVARKIDFIHRMMGPSSYEEMLQIFEQRAAPWQRSVAALREIGRIAREAELPVYAFLLPATFQTYEAQRPVYEGAEAAVREAGLPVYSLLPDFAATGQAPQHFQINLIDGHPNADYNVLAAGKIFEELRRSGEMERLIENTDGYYMSHDMPPEREHDR
jgi:hypothetical protein